MSRKEMRALGYRVIDMLVEHFDMLPTRPVMHIGKRADLEERLREPLPEKATDVSSVINQLREDVLNHISHVDHPRFFAFVPSPSNFVSVMADTLAAGFNVFAGTWLEASGPAEIELITLDWLRQLCNLPDTAGGLFVSGGSMANITALTVARHTKLRDQIRDAVAYYSDQTHSSVERGLRVLGFEATQLRKLPTEDAFRLSLPDLEREVARDRAAGRVPFCVIANVGTTNTGAVDPLTALAEFCGRERLWLHADGAYGAAAVLSEKGRRRLNGLDRVDSLALDPHKWLFQPYEIGCVLVRDRRELRETFHILPEYLKDTERAEEEINFCDYGIQLTRSFRALKLWMSLKVFGLESFREAVGRGIGHAELAEEHLRALPNWEVITPAQLGIVTFRFIPEGALPSKVNELNQRLVEQMIANGFAMVSSTSLRGRSALRMCTINPRTTEADIRESITKLASLGTEIKHR
jgi:glutamate/tyrosine decarboxylase-like PLP-dependent enzyme